MRFDDRIATVLTLPADRADRQAARWRQLVDLLAQRRPEGASSEIAAAYLILRAERSAVDPALRRQAARALAGRHVAPELLAFFAEDSASIAAPLIAEARLDREEWLAVLPGLGPAARALLRHREDLDLEVRQALRAFGSSDFVLESGAAGEAAAPAEPPVDPEQSDSQIRELVARIEAFRKQRGDLAEEGPVEARAAEGFRWETGTDGILLWVEGAPRAALVGLSLAMIAWPGQQGVDGQAAGAFEKRAPFRDARLTVPGEGSVAGEWRISGVPWFDPRRGSFQGYRGTARRPRPDETAHGAEAAAGLFGTNFPADSLRQLIHELRTPLNAIIGFAEMIEGQYLGPAAAGYRDQAAEIAGQARGLLGAVDDLDTAARLESRRYELGVGEVDAGALLAQLNEAYEGLAESRGAAIALEIASPLPLARVEHAAAERMLGRLLTGAIGLAGEGEILPVSLAPGGKGLRLAVARPQSIAGASEMDLLDPGYSPKGDWPAAPALGLGFALRLVRNLAEAVGGGLTIGANAFTLELPMAPIAGSRAEASGQA